MSNTFPIFEIPIIAPDLRQEETLIQIADCLDYLTKVTDVIFNCINTRISENSKKIIELQKRASIAQMKVNKLKGVKKATQIFSSSKYPASDIHKDYVSIFSNTPKLPFTPSNVNILEKHTFVKDVNLEEKLQFFHVKNAQVETEVNSEEGLGKLPLGIESVSSLLLFNTLENPYEKYVSLDPMGVVNKFRKNIIDEASSRMEEAPISITKQEQLDEQIKENYFYSPSLGNVPKIDAPIDLPDLPGIADDLRYSLDLGPGFAPSVTTTPAVPDLPTIPEDSFKDLPPVESLQREGVPIASTLVSTPPPPPPPPPSLSPPPSPSAVSNSATLPPLPPPPPPPPPPPETVQSEKPIQPAPAIIHATSDDARANLMAAIRSAGGKPKLRPLQNGRDESKRLKEEKNLAAGGGDLMADLHNKLLMRRKGISGKTKKEVSAPVSVMDKVLAMIPPPVQQYDVSSATEDEDWED